MIFSPIKQTFIKEPCGKEWLDKERNEYRSKWILSEKTDDREIRSLRWSKARKGSEGMRNLEGL